MARAFRFPLWLLCLATLLTARVASAAPILTAEYDGNAQPSAVHVCTVRSSGAFVAHESGPTRDLTALAGRHLVAPSPDTSDDDAAAQSSVALELQAGPAIACLPIQVRAFAAESVVVVSSVPSTLGPRPPPSIR